MCSIEQNDAFDRFSLWSIVRNAPTATSLTIATGESIGNEFACFLLVTVQYATATTAQRELHLFEHHLTVKQFEDNTVSRDDYVERMQSLLEPRAVKIVHFVHITSEPPNKLPVTGNLHFLRHEDLKCNEVGKLPANVLHLISTVRYWQKNDNVYHIRLANGSLREVVQAAEISPSKQPLSEHHIFIEPDIIHGIELRDYVSPLSEDESDDLFLVRHATVEDIKRHAKDGVVSCVADITPTTRFLVNDDVSLSSLSAHRSTIHEVEFSEDYVIFFWQRTIGHGGDIYTHLTVEAGEPDDYLPPPKVWLNVLVSDETDGASSYFRQLLQTSRRWNAFRLAALIEWHRIYDVMRHEDVHIHSILSIIYEAVTPDEQRALQHGNLLLLIDHCDDESQESISCLHRFLDRLQTNRTTVWIVTSRPLWIGLASRYAIAYHRMPQLDEIGQKDYLARFLDSTHIDTVLRRVRAENHTNAHIEGNMFYLSIVAELARVETAAQESFLFVDLLEFFAKAHITGATEELIRLEELSYHAPEVARKEGLCKTVVQFFAAKYLIRNRTLIDLDNYWKYRKYLDPLLFRHSAAAKAVLNGNVECLSKMQEDLATVDDILQRNLLHISHGTNGITDLLLRAGLSVEQPCPQLSHFTPLQMADYREDWPTVGLLLQHGASANFRDLKLRKLSGKQLSKVLLECFVYGCTALTTWILDNHVEYLITQFDIYNLVTYNKLNDEVTIRILNLASEQNLHLRDPSNAFNWGYTALDNALDDKRYKVARCLVDKLQFQCTTEIPDADDAASIAMELVDDTCSDEDLYEEQTLEDNSSKIPGSDFSYMLNYDQAQLASLNFDYRRQYHESGDLFLHYYVRHGNSNQENTFRYLLTKYDDIDVLSREGETALHVAILNNKFRFVELLLAAGANVNAQTTHMGWNALHCASVATSRRLFDKLLIDCGMDIASADESGRTVIFHLNPCHRLTGLVHYLVHNYGLDVNAQDNDGRTVLHRTLIDDRYFTQHDAEILLRCYGVQQSVADGRGRLPLHYAVESSSWHIVQLLLKYRTDLTQVRDNANESCVDIAKRRGQSKILWLLQAND